MIPAEAVEEWVRIGAAFLLMILVVVAMLSVLALGMHLMQKRGTK